MIASWNIAAHLSPLALIVTAVASASVDTTPQPGGIVPLKPGIYVAKGSTCGNPPNAAIRDYDRRSFATASARACRAQRLSRRGSTYRIVQYCFGAREKASRRISDDFVISVENAISFKLQRNGQSTEYRYCPIYMLPEGLLPRLR